VPLWLALLVWLVVEAIVTPVALLGRRPRDGAVLAARHAMRWAVLGAVLVLLGLR
jgi:uncharacterized protein (DUF983 family)